MNAEFTRNPFAFATVQGQFECYAQERRLYTLSHLVSAPAGVVVLNLHGPRWMGKSTILRCLCDDACSGRERFDLGSVASDGMETLFLYFDLESKASDGDVFASIATEIQRRLSQHVAISLQEIADKIAQGQNGTQLPVLVASDWLSFLLSEAKQKGLRIVLCLDHLDKTDLLRVKANLRQLNLLADSVSLIFATRKTLDKTYPALRKEPFIKRSQPMVVDLSYEKAIELLRAPTAGDEWHFSDEDVDKLITLVGRIPRLLLLAAWQAYELLADSPMKRESGLTVQDIRGKIGAGLSLYFETLMDDHREALEQFYLFETKKTLELDEDIKEVIRQELQQAGLIYEAVQPDWKGSKKPLKFHYFSPLFKSYVVEKMKDNASAARSEYVKRMNVDEICRILDVRDKSKEAAVLATLVANSGQIISDEQMAATIWRGKDPGRAIPQTVLRVRKKFRDHPDEIPGRIIRHTNEGYSFEWAES